MGEGGYIALTNGTPYTWRRTNQEAYQMEGWSFPETISAGDVQRMYVEFKQSIFTTRTDTIGKCTYSLEGTTSSFSVEAKDEPSNLKIILSGMSTSREPHGSVIDLGWIHDGVVYATISGKDGAFNPVSPWDDWMHRLLPTIGNRSLSQICIPGTHDAGMGALTHWDPAALPSYILEFLTRTQEFTINGQLMLGSRYFDIRPQVSSTNSTGGAFWTGHYDNSSRIGGRGESIASIIDAVNNFTSNCAELVILNFSHAINADDGFREMNQGEWDRLMGQLKNIKHLHIVSDANVAKDLSLCKVNDFIGNNHAAVLCVIEAPKSITLGQYANQGFFLQSQLNVQNDYANTNDCVAMKQHQLQKMKDHYSTNDKRLFLLSWTLTQQMPSFSGVPPIMDLISWMSKFKSVETMAYSANQALLTDLLPHVNRQSFPNVVYVDYIRNRNLAALAIAINERY